MGLREEWLDVRAREAEFRERRKELQAKLLAEMGSVKQEFSYGGKALTLTPVTGVKTIWDKDGVRDALSVPLRRRLCVVVLDTDKFTAALKSGELDVAKFADFRTVEPIEPYIRVSSK